MTRYSKEDDYTLCASTTVIGSKGVFSRYFNFAAEQVTTIFSERAELSTNKAAGSSQGGVAVAVSVALTSQMSVQKFSDFDSQVEIDLMRAELKKLGGNPPEMNATPGKSRATPRLGQ
ncbi:MAG: hypothetical protein PW788_00690 [Micavibrio sp.]|nr:hypothetical protein [Micavibrio sp.]